MSDFVIISPGETRPLYVQARNVSGQLANQTAKAVESYSDAHWAQYVVPLSDLGNGYYSAPVTDWMAGQSWIALGYRQLGSTPDVADTFLGEDLISTTGVSSQASGGRLITPDFYRSVTGSTASDDVANHFIASATTQIESLCQRSFTTADRNETLSGSGLPWLTLSGTPVAIASIHIDDVDHDPAHFGITGNLIYFVPEFYNLFAEGLANVTVSYSASVQVPAPVAEACWRLASQIERHADPEWGYGLTEKAELDQKIKYTNGSSDPITDDKVISLLRPYILPVLA